MSSEFRYKRRVQFADTDLAGIVHFSTMFKYMEEAEHALWRACGLSIAERNGPFGWPRLNAALEFRSPLHFEEEFEVVVRIAALKTRTLDYEFVLRRGDTLIALGTMSCICVRKQPNGTMKAAEISSDIATKLSAFLEK